MLDISRLIWRGQRAAPSGIDRVELAYAEYFLAKDARRPAYAVIHVMGWVFGVNDAGARRFVQKLAVRWRGEPGDMNRGRLARLGDLYGSLLMGHWRIGFQLRREFRRHAAAPIFLVVSHHHLSLDHTIRRIRRSFGARCACFLHDLIPLDYPEYFPPRLARGFKRLPETIADCFDAVIANSRTTAEALRTVLSALGGPRVPGIRVAAPGARAFPMTPRGAELPEQPHSVPYFIVLGTIEPRKNHLLLLNLWVRLASTLETVPRLLVIGARGWENEQVVDMLERSNRLRGVVEEHPTLDDTAVGSLLGAARAVLVPSFVEGYGLPLVEALASGVPVICSDIPVFREVGRDVPDYADPLDLPAWQHLITDYARPDSARRAAQLERLARWRAPRWADHFEIVETALDAIDRPTRADA
jgi:glycosyltransferase involved in cell wall biosynthesis